MSKRPNFLFLITDQHRPDHTGFGGNEIVQTSHLDAVAARGGVFDRAFVANPICMPNRSTIMTGRMPSVHGTRYNGVPLNWRVNTFVRVLRAHGYRTTHMQNLHAVIRHRLLIEEDEKSDPIDAGHPLRMRTLVTPQARLTLYQGHPHGELFALTVDPLEQHNLFGTAKGAALQTEMTRALADEMMQVMNETPRPTAMA